MFHQTTEYYYTILYKTFEIYVQLKNTDDELPLFQVKD